MANIGKIEGQGSRCLLVLHGFYDDYDAEDGIEVLYKIKSPDRGQALDLSAYADAQGYLRGTGHDDDGNLSVEIAPQVNNALCLSRVTRFLVSIKAGLINSEYECQAVNLNPIAVADAQEPQSAPETESAPQSSFAQEEPQTWQQSEPEIPATPQAQPPKPKSILPMLLGLLLLVLIAGAAAYFFLGSGGSGTTASTAPAAQEESPEESAAPEPQEEPDAQEEQAVAETPATASSTQSLCPVSADVTDQELVQKCQALNDSDAMLALALEAADSGRCDLSKRILMSYGRQAGGQAFANAYAQFLDPDTPSHPCFAKSRDDAEYWRQKGGN